MTDTALAERNGAGPSEAALDFAVRGMTCGSCANRVQRTLNKQPGVARAEVNFATATAHVVLAEQPADPAALTTAVAKAGYELHRQAGAGNGSAATPIASTPPVTETPAGEVLQAQAATEDSTLDDEEAATQRAWLWRMLVA